MASDTHERSGLEKLLSVITEVSPGEGVTALLLTLNVFILLTAYYVIKPVREALILVMEGGAENKSYMGAAIAVALLFAVPLYAKVAERFQRNRLVIGVTLFFASNLVLFYVGSSIEAVRVHLGLVFYGWVGIFNMMVVAQFWAFANDVYTVEQGKRLFALVGLGASLGAAVGSGLSKLLIGPLGVYTMLLVCAALLGLFSFIIQVVHVREARRAGGVDYDGETPDAPPEMGREGAYKLVFSHRYLTLLALFSLLFTFVNTNGEYMLSRLVGESASEMVASGELSEAEKGAWIGEFYGEFFLYVNILGVATQTFLVSRLVKWFGLGRAFFVLPVIALLDAVAVAVLPMLFVLRVGKTLENSTDYSLNNTLRNMLWLPTSTEVKYKAKQAVDTLFVRMGDVSSALLVFVGTSVVDISVRGFAVVNLVLVAAWLVVARLIVKDYQRLTESGGLTKA